MRLDGAAGGGGLVTRDRPRRRFLWVVLVGGLAVFAGLGLLVVGFGGSGAGGAPQVLAETPVTDMDLRGRVAVTSPMVARDPTEPAFVVAATRGDAPGPGCGLQVSGDGGQSWLEIDALATLPEGIGACYQPQVAFSADGRLVYSFIGMVGPPPEPEGVYVIVSDDRGQTFTQPRRLADLDTTTSRMTVSARGIEMVWLDPVQEAEWGRVGPPWPVGPQVHVAVGDAGGLGESVVVADPDGLVAAPTIAGDPDGAAAVAYYELPSGVDVEDGVASLAGQGPWRLMVARRTDDGYGEPVQVAELNWADQAVSEAELLPSEDMPDVLQPLLLTRWGIAEPGLAVRDGQICVSWTDGFLDGQQAMVSCSAGESQWSDPVRLTAGADGPQAGWLPQLAISPSGGVQAVFHGRDDPAEETVDVWFASADEPGGEFADAIRLTSMRSSPYASPRPGWFGTSMGLAAGEDSAVAMWADSRNAEQLRTNQAVFAAVVDTPEGLRGPLGWAGGGLLAGGLLLALGGLFAGRRRGTVGDQEPSDLETPPTAKAAQR